MIWIICIIGIVTGLLGWTTVALFAVGALSIYLIVIVFLSDDLEELGNKFKYDEVGVVQ